jgi:TPR repeat protein
MRISERLIPVALFTMGLGLASAFAFDGTRSPNDVSPAVGIDVAPRDAISAPALAPPTPALATPGMGLRTPETKKSITAAEAFRSGAQSLRAGDTMAAMSSLEYAAARGHTVAQWKLGRMYADGVQVKRDDYRAFQFFQEIADAHADDSPGTPQAPFVANALVSLGLYYADGIPNSTVKADPSRAREMFAYAASYFGDADAQYHLGRMYFDGKGGARDVRQAARWLSLSATKGQPQAQALLGTMLFRGDGVPRQAARGLMWLTLARDAAPQDKRIAELHAVASQQATDDQRALALTFIESWLNGGRRE